MARRGFNPFDKHFENYQDEEFDRPTKKTCNRCGKKNLIWEDDNGKWILLDSKSGEIHRCSKKKNLDVDVNKLLNGKP